MVGLAAATPTLDRRVDRRRDADNPPAEDQTISAITPSASTPSAINTRALIDAYYDRFNRRDWPAFLGLLTDDVVHDINQGEREVGVAAFAAFMARMDRCYAEEIQDLSVTVSADGTRAAAEFLVSGRYLATDAGLPAARGQAYRLPAGAFFEVRDQRIARVTNYYNLAHWLRQVGA